VRKSEKIGERVVWRTEGPEKLQEVGESSRIPTGYVKGPRAQLKK
jgi:hypothetical protein